MAKSISKDKMKLFLSKKLKCSTRDISRHSDWHYSAYIPHILKRKDDELNTVDMYIENFIDIIKSDISGIVESYEDNCEQCEEELLLKILKYIKDLEYGKIGDYNILTKGGLYCSTTPTIRL